MRHQSRGDDDGSIEFNESKRRWAREGEEETGGGAMSCGVKRAFEIKELKFFTFCDMFDLN